MLYSHVDINMLSFLGNALRKYYRMNFAGAGVLKVTSLNSEYSCNDTCRMTLTLCYKSETKCRNYIIMIEISISICNRS